MPIRIVFAGTPAFSVPALDALVAAGHSIAAVYCQPDRPAGRGRTVEHGPVKRRALELGLPVEQPSTLRDPAAVARLASHRPDLMVVVAYGLILPQAVLDVPRLGCLNIPQCFTMFHLCNMLRRDSQARPGPLHKTALRVQRGSSVGRVLDAGCGNRHPGCCTDPACTLRWLFRWLLLTRFRFDAVSRSFCAG